MEISYNKLLKMLTDKGMNKTTCDFVPLEVYTMAKRREYKNVTSATFARIALP